MSAGGCGAGRAGQALFIEAGFGASQKGLDPTKV
jgi:hypothetical protein